MAGWAAPSTPHDYAVLGVLHAVRAFSDAMDRMYGEIKGDMEMNTTDLAALRMLVVREQRSTDVSPHDLAVTSGYPPLRPASSWIGFPLRAMSSGARTHGSAGAHRRAHRRVPRAFFTHFGARLEAMRAVADRYSDEELATITRFIGEICEVVDPQ